MAELQANWAHINRQVSEAAWGQSGAVVELWATRFGVSKDKIYAELRKRFGKKKTIVREVKVDPDNELLQMIFDQKLIGKMMHLKRRELATEICIENLVKRGIKGAENLSVSTVNRRLRTMGFRERQPNKRIESLYANQVHMIDFSRSKYFQIFDKDHDGDFMLVVSGKELHYKQEDTRLRTWIVQVVDDYSRLRKVKAYAETNESAFLGLDHLNYCWLPTEEDEHLMKYLPVEMLRSDNGAFRKSKETQTAMEEMGIVMPAQMPGRKGGTAKVENRMRSLWQQFELPLAIQLGAGNRIRLSEYNELLAEFCVKEHYQKHPVQRGFTKGEWYSKSLADRSQVQRTTDVDLIRIACHVEKRTVDDHLRISIDNVYYEVPQYVDGRATIGQQIYVHINKYGELSGKLIDDLSTSKFELTEWEPSTWGAFESFALTDVRKREDAFEKEAPTMKSITGMTSPAGKASTSSEEGKVETSTKKVKYMQPIVEEVEALDSAFVQQAPLKKGAKFNTVLDARAYVGNQIETYDLTFNQVAEYFGDLLDNTPIYEAELKEVINQIYADFDSGKLVVNF
ncbi:MAG: hypothetical protein RLN90_09660 [Balneolaceae bacterium]